MISQHGDYKNKLADKCNKLCRNNLGVEGLKGLKADINVGILELIEDALALDLRIDGPGAQSLDGDTSGNAGSTERILKKLIDKQKHFTVMELMQEYLQTQDLSSASSCARQDPRRGKQRRERNCRQC